VGDGITRGEKYSHDRAGRLLTTTDAAAFTETNEYNAHEILNHSLWQIAQESEPVPCFTVRAYRTSG